MLFKLSIRNMKKSFKDYAIYFLTLVLGVAIFYMFNSIDSQQAMLEVSESTRSIIKLMISLLGYVSVFVAVVLGLLIVYANNFLINRRKKEFGIYMTLGMGKRQISKIILIETILVGIISLIVGLIIGIFASQFMSILVAKMFEADMSKFQFVFSKDACIKTCIYFAVMYVAVMFFNTFTVSRYKLIDLLNASKKNENVKITYKKKIKCFQKSYCNSYINMLVYKYSSCKEEWKMKLPFNIDLKDKVCVVTGGTGILCGAMADALAECGAKVAILALGQEACDNKAKEINEKGGIAIGIDANVLDKESLKKAHEIINKELGPVDILINGAGGNHPKGTTTKEYLEIEDLENEELTTFFDLDPKGVEFVFNLNFLGTLLPSQEFSKDMLNKDGATIINISSMNAFTPLTKIPAYSGAKAAVSNFTQWLAVHMSKVGVRVNAIAPGFFVTAQNQKLLFNEDGTPTARTEKILNSTPMKRFGEADELIGTLLYLVSEEASGFVNGVVIPVDGAFSAYSGV